MLYKDLLYSALNNSLRGMSPMQNPALDAIGIADTLFPVVSQSVCEAAASNPMRRSLVERQKSITLAAGSATLTSDVLTAHAADAILIDPANLSKKYVFKTYPDFVRRGDRRLGIFTLQGQTTLQVIEPGAALTIPLTATGARTLTIPCVIVKPALATDAIDAPDELISDLDEALANSLRGALIKAAGEAA